MSVNSWLRKAKRSVAALDADLILAEVLGFEDRSKLVLKGGNLLTDDERARADAMLARRQDGEPLAYILGRKEFYGREFLVTPDTLIPRPETEDIIDEVKALAGASFGVDNQLADNTNTLAGKDQPLLRNPKILDVGTGSGCIGITLVLEIPEAEVTCIDISRAALKVAQKNAELLDARKVKFLESDLLKNYGDAKPEVIVANLPYVDRAWDWISPSIRYEPEMALFAEDSGLALIKLMLDEIHDLWYNKSNGSLRIFLEADPCQHEQIMHYAAERGFRPIKSYNYILELMF